jgi:hypothetical protein
MVKNIYVSPRHRLRYTPYAEAREEIREEGWAPLEKIPAARSATNVARHSRVMRLSVRENSSSKRNSRSS